jgi:hypothetical protein
MKASPRRLPPFGSILLAKAEEAQGQMIGVDPRHISEVRKPAGTEPAILLGELGPFPADQTG